MVSRYIYNDEDNSPMHEENMTNENGCRNCPGKFWCEEPKTQTDYKECETLKVIARWWHDVKSGRRDRAKGITEEDYEED